MRIQCDTTEGSNRSQLFQDLHDGEVDEYYGNHIDSTGAFRHAYTLTATLEYKISDAICPMTFVVLPDKVHQKFIMTRENRKIMLADVSELWVWDLNFNNTAMQSNTAYDRAMGILGR